MKQRILIMAVLATLTGVAMADEGRRGGQFPPHLDTDGDGQLSVDEFRGPGDRMFMDADADGDSRVTLEEMRAHHEQMKARMQERLDRQAAAIDDHFHSMDTDGDGAVTADEARIAAFQRKDRNGDGFLTTDEMRPPRRPGDRDFPPGRHAPKRSKG